MMRRALLLVALVVGLAALSSPVEAQLSLTKSCVLLNAVTTASSGSLCDVSQMSVLAIAVTATEDTYRLNFEGTLDNSNWYPITCYPQGSATGATALTTTNSGSASPVNYLQALWRCNVAGYLGVRMTVASITHKTGASITAKGSGFSNPFGLGGVVY